MASSGSEIHCVCGHNRGLAVDWSGYIQRTSWTTKSVKINKVIKVIYHTFIYIPSGSCGEGSDEQVRWVGVTGSVQ